MSDADFEVIRQLQAERKALAAAEKKASREVHEATQTSSSKMATADSAESFTADGLSIRIDEESRLDDTVEGSEDLPETKKQSAIWTAHIFLLPNKSLRSPFERNSNAYKRCISRGLKREVAVDGPSSEAFASAVSQAFGPLLQNRPWAPLQATLRDADHLQELLMLRPLGPELIGSKYDLEFLRAQCAVLDLKGKIYSVYIALLHSTLSWDFLRTSPVVIPGLEASWAHDPMLDADYSFASEENYAEYNSTSAENLGVIEHSSNAVTNGIPIVRPLAYHSGFGFEESSNAWSSISSADSSASSTRRPYHLPRQLDPDSRGHNIGPDAVWTRIKRNLVSAQVLQEAGLHYKARPDYLAVLGVLSREEIAELAQKSVELRASREGEAPSKIEDQQCRSALVLSPDSAHLTDPEGMSPKESATTESTTITILAAYTDQRTLESFFGRLFGYGKVSILCKGGGFHCTLPRKLNLVEQGLLEKTVHRESYVAENPHSSASTTDKETGDLSDLESLASVTDVPSLTSGTTFSSLGSQLDISEATEELARLLLKDEELGPLFRASLQRTAADKVERNYTRLLAGFAKDLRKEATNSVEHHVGRIVKFRARFISQTLVSALDPSRHGRTAQLESFLHQNEHSEGRLEQFLESLAMSGGFVEATKGAPPPIDSDVNMSDESGEEGHLPKLSQIKDFILSSKALAILRTRLKEFVSPEEALSGVIQQGDTEGSQGAQGRSEEPFDGRLSNLEIVLGALIGLVMRVDQCTVSRLTDSVLKIVRPRIPQDHQRISWICGCGKPMYSDVQELYAGGAADLEHELRHAADGAARSRATSSSNNAPRGTMQLRQGSSSSNTSAMSGSTLAPQQGADSTPSTSATQSGSVSTAAPGPGHLITNRFVLLCVNGPRLPQLRQVPLTSQQVSFASHDNDLILFDNIRRAYIEVRRSYQPSFHPETPALVRLSVGSMHRVWSASQKLTTEVFKMLRLRWLVWWIGDDVFIVPKSAEFVKFEVVPIKEDHVPAILQSTCLPPEEEVLKKKTYHYAPCPQRVQNPLLRIPWLHVLFEPGMHTSDFWTKRTPKKLIEMLKYPSTDPVIGWGVQIVEGPNWHAFVVLMVIFILLSLATASIYSAVTRDVSSGFSVGAFFLAAEAIVVAWVLAVVAMSLRYDR